MKRQCNLQSWTFRDCSYIALYTQMRKHENLIKLMKLCAAQPASLPPLKILEQKAIAPRRGALTETSTKTTHRWNLQSPHYLRSRSSFQTIAFENPDWPTHPILYRLLKKGNFWFFLPNLVLQFFGLFHINPGLTFILHRIENQQMKVEN